jgi:hypothetical protein
MNVNSAQPLLLLTLLPHHQLTKANREWCHRLKNMQFACGGSSLAPGDV